MYVVCMCGCVCVSRVQIKAHMSSEHDQKICVCVCVCVRRCVVVRVTVTKLLRAHEVLTTLRSVRVRINSLSMCVCVLYYCGVSHYTRARVCGYECLCVSEANCS